MFRKREVQRKTMSNHTFNIGTMANNLINDAYKLLGKGPNINYVTRSSGKGKSMECDIGTIWFKLRDVIYAGPKFFFVVLG